MGKKLMETIYIFSEWFYRIFYLNVLWMLGTAAGFGFLGFFPSIAATICTLQILWEEGDMKEISVLSVFKANYKKHFKLSNQIGYSLSIAVAVLVTDLAVLASWESLLFQLLSAVLFIILVIAFVFSSLIFFIISKFELGFFNTLKQGVFIVFSYPAHVFLNGIVLAVFLLTFYLIPFISVLGGIVVLFLINTWIIQSIFKRIRKDQSTLLKTGSLNKGG
ncbi:YesL family protein [Marinococcus sp. PL1-022]|uniref:YesL family protein n=1 Tax=Marinococcus sp. PL1-022 TaxID=3095363 RepID=UPI0029C3A7ED|nr:DUF624 domain-containing protein [Marinococcus sp. PL1-022]MDX6152582.1 DUF624 domain-containing protein [Marinococcus sp. PL1-022]